MTDEKLLQIIETSEKAIEAVRANNREAAAERWSHPDLYPVFHRQYLNHALWMLGEMRTLIAGGRREKAMRWLGFVQGVMFTTGVRTIEQMKKDNKSDEQVRE